MGPRGDAAIDIKALERMPISFYDLKPQLRDYVYRHSMEAFAAGDRARDGISTVVELTKRIHMLRSNLLENVGGLPPLNTPLNARTTRIVYRPGYRIENIIFESRPRTYVTANLYVPDDGDFPRGAVLFAPGHCVEGKLYEPYLKVCQYLVQAGLVVLAFDPIGQGERLSYYDPISGKTTVPPATGEHNYAGVQCWPLGDGLARYFIHDLKRAVDYLCERPEVDRTKIGVTGNSGGGTQTALAMICDERIAAAAPATFITSRAAKMYTGNRQDAEQIWPGMSALGFDHEDILLAMAPKPVLVLAATEDFFPIEGTRRTVERARKFWDLCGEGDKLQLFEDECPHMYSIPMAEAAASFFAKHLMQKKVDPTQFRIELPDPASLICTKSGQVRGDYAEARAVYEENGDRLTELERRRISMVGNTRVQRAKDWLHRTVWANRSVCELNPRYLNTRSVDGESLTVQNILWQSQERLFNHALLVRDGKYDGQALPVTVAVWEGGSGSLEPHLSWLRSHCERGNMAMVVDLAGVGALSPHAMDGAPHPSDTVRKLAMDLLWLNDSLAAVRIFDLLRALQLARALKGGSFVEPSVYAHGTFGMYASLAAFMDERVRSVQIEQSFGSVADWIRQRHYEHSGMSELVLPGMLQFLDL